MTGEPACSLNAAPTTQRGLVIAPFRAVRYDTARIPDVADVTAPPYDVIDVDDRATLESGNPYNIVRLILPPMGGSGRREYARAARTLRSWLDSGVLVTDPEPGLYVYEQASDSRLQRGLIGALALRQPEEHIVLPHEDVMRGPVDDRLELMRATAANLEPILLQYDGGDKASDVVDEVCRTAPLLQATSRDGARHRVWQLRDPGPLAAVEADMAERQALIADGHHRYAAYLRLQAEHHAAGRGSGPWDYGLALLVDATRYPLQIRGIHRVLPHIAAETLAAQANRHARVEELASASPQANLARLDGVAGAAFLLADAQRQWIISDVDRDLVERLIPPGPPDLWRELDATVLHNVLLEHVWRIPDTSEAVVYHHSVDSALRHARRSDGAAILMRPAEVATVFDLARRGIRMPRKSTSFGPKPRSGLVLRLFATA